MEMNPQENKDEIQIDHIDQKDQKEDISTPKQVKSIDIDKITLELMMNKTHYQKYLSKQNPAKYKEAQEYIQKVRKYKSQIDQLTENLLNDSCKSNAPAKYTLDINNSFSEYLRTCVKHFEIQELEYQAELSHDPNIMFENVIEPTASASYDNVNDSDDDDEVDTPSSVWGKPVIKKKDMSYYTMDMYAKKR